MISVGIYNNEILMIIYSIIPLVFAIAASCVGAYDDAYIIINISSTIGTIEIKKNKFLFCYNTQEILKINDVKQVIVQSENSSFKIFFKLKDGREVEGCIYIDNKNGEGRKAFEIIRNNLPQNISFSGDLAY